MSPHLSIYRFYVSMVLSVIHRLTGVANYWGSLLLAAWLLTAAMGDEEFETVNSLLGTPIGLLILIGFTWSFFHHMLGGIRHFIWDTVNGFDKPTIKLLSWGTLFCSLTLTAIFWAVAFSMWGKN